LSGEFQAEMSWQIAITFAVPFAVAVFASRPPSAGRPVVRSAWSASKRPSRLQRFQTEIRIPS
jgi:hypothetical protein